MRILFVLCAVFGFSSAAWAGKQYVCGTGDRAQRVIYKYKSPSISAAKKAAIRACHINSRRRSDCSAPYCVAFQAGQPDRPYRAPKRRSGISEAEEAAMRAIQEFKRRQREQKIDDLIRRAEEEERNRR